MKLPRHNATPALAKKALSLMMRSPRLVRVSEPDQLGVEREHPQLAFGVRLVELAEPNRELAVDRHVLHAGRIDPLANSVVVLAARVVELQTLDVDRPAGEEVIATAVV